MHRVTTKTLIGGAASLALLASASLIATATLPHHPHINTRHLSSSSTLITPSELNQARKACTPGMTVQKCDEEIAGLTAPHTAPGPPPVPIPQPDESPTMIQCSPTFFNSQETAALQNQFGMLTCFRFAGTSSWVVIGNGMSTTSTTTPPAPSPGGSIVATYSCQANDTTCLNPNEGHNFSLFTTYSPPYPLNGRMNLEETYGTNILILYVGNCGIFAFDLTNDTWYPGNLSAINMFQNGQIPTQTFTGSPPRSGLQALIGPAPAATMDGCVGDTSNG